MTALVRASALGLALLGATVPAWGQGVVAERWAPGVISTDGGEAFPSFTPDGDTLYFSTHDEHWSSHTIVVSRRTATGWSDPEIVSFSGVHEDRKPFLSPDGRKLFFSSNRPLSEAGEPGVFNLWVTERREDGGWAEPHPLPSPINTAVNDYHAAVTADGTLYFASRDRPGGKGRSDLYRSIPAAGAYASVEPLNSINSDRSEPDLYVDPDQRFMILAITDHPAGFGGDDLYISYRQDGGWTEPRNLGEPINSSEYEYGPLVSPDSRWLYFTTHRDGSADIYRVALKSLRLLPEDGE